MTDMMSDFKDRELTALAVIGVALGSAVLNVWGAFHVFPDPFAAYIVAFGIAGCELVALLTPRHIAKDFDNRHYWKARFSAVILVFAIAGCVYSGKQAFSVLFLTAEHQHSVLEKRAEARQLIADDYLANVSTEASDKGITVEAATKRWERLQEQADDALLAQKKASPPPQEVVYILLALFEMVKIAGLFFLATEKGTIGKTWKQRRADRNHRKFEKERQEAQYEAKLKAMRQELTNVTEFPGKAA